MIRSRLSKADLLGRANRLAASGLAVALAVALAMTLAVALAATAPSLSSAEPTARKAAGEDLAWSPPQLPECTCRAQGKTFQLGEHVCLATPNGFRLAQCELTQNVTSWRFSSDDCVTSQREGTGVERHLAEACFVRGPRRI